MDRRFIARTSSMIYSMTTRMHYLWAVRDPYNILITNSSTIPSQNNAALHNPIIIASAHTPKQASERSKTAKYPILQTSRLRRLKSRLHFIFIIPKSTIQFHDSRLLHHLNSIAEYTIITHKINCDSAITTKQKQWTSKRRNRSSARIRGGSL